MKKIPTLFERDWNGDKSLVTREVNPQCQWVADGEGIATLKIDGTCCLVRDGALFKRREVKSIALAPAGFEVTDIDDVTGKVVGWMPVGDEPEDRYHREAWEHETKVYGRLPDGTYELIGPKVQGNPETVSKHLLIAHKSLSMHDRVPRDFDGLRDYFLANSNKEGIVWQHPDGRMAKIKLRDFGIKRTSK